MLLLRANRRRSTSVLAAWAVALLGLAAGAQASLIGTTMDITIGHTGPYGFTGTVTHTYGGSSTIVDPSFPQFFIVQSSPAGAAGYDNSILLDFADFAYGDFSGETGTITIESIAEDIDSLFLGLIDENGSLIGTISGSGDTFTGSWSVDDVVNAGTGTMLVVGWNSASGGIVAQPRSGDPLLGLTPDQLIRFDLGRIQFDRVLTIEDGLGPVFNKNSCGNCHSEPLGGPGNQTVTRFGFNDKKGGGFDPLEDWGGSLLQAQAISPECAETLPPPEVMNVMTPRVTNGNLGYGLVEAIPDDELLALETTPPPGVSGKAHIVQALEDPGVDRVGRFGWKSQVPTILTFAGDAGLNELGLTNRLIMTENDPNGIHPPNLGDPDFCDTVADPEDGPEGGVPGAPHFIDRVTDFMRFLAPPPQTPQSGMAGEVLFESIGCANCHVRSFITRDDPVLEEAIRNKEIRAYSDFLLHDMGLGADGIEQGMATTRELRTTPLMGLRTRDPMWHDGRFAAGTFEQRARDSIDEHGQFGAESIPVHQNWVGLTPLEQDQVIQFLDSLGRREFDADGDDVVDLTDYFAFVDCLDGPGSYGADDPCAIMDVDQNGEVNLDDWSVFLTVYTGPMEDCNDNGILDLTEIVDGSVADADGDGVPDECTCVGDLDGTGDIGFLDLLDVLSNWGPCVGCPQDLDDDGLVGFLDLLFILSNWGPCE